MVTKERIKNVLLYAGIGRENYRIIEPTIIKINRGMLKMTSMAAVILTLIMLVCSHLLEEPDIDHIVHGVALIVSVVLYAISATVVSRYDWIVRPVVHLFCSIFYIYGILMGTVVDPTDKTVLFVVMLVSLPVVFADRPLHITVIAVFYIIVFICACSFVKSGPLLVGDIRNTLAFGFLGITSGVISDCHKINGASTRMRLKKFNHKLKEESRTDALTRMQNRNAYEMDFYKIAKRCKESLGCIYIDINGLKTLNDNQGHEAGDEMLKYVAERILCHFGEEFSYRIGGDEFVAFSIDPQFYEIKDKSDKFLAEIGKRGYYASVGWKIHDLEVLSMKDLISTAESEMYHKKVDFYKQVGFDRRRTNT